MLSQNISYKNFNSNNHNKKKIIKIFKKLIKTPNQVLFSLSSSYKNSYDKKFITKLKKFKNFRLIGMGGSILGAKAIYNFLKPKSKKFQFIDNFSTDFLKKNKKKMLH